jgi:phenylacetate-CoA ligase
MSVSRKRLWDSVPASLRRLVGPALGALGLGRVLGRAFRRELVFADSAQYWPVDRARAYQLEQTRKLCHLACRDSEYYRQVLSSGNCAPPALESLDRFGEVRTINREVVRKHMATMCTSAVGSRSAETVSTGGTGGEPVRFALPIGRSAVEYAYLVTSWKRAGFSLGMPMAVLRGRVVKADRRGLRHEYDPLLRHHYYSAFHMTDENMGRYLEHIATIGPCFLHVYPSSVSALARFCRRSGQRPPGNIRGIIAESEIVYPEQRKMAEEVFGCRYFSCYGQSEKVVLAAECEHSTDYHVWPTYGYFELLDEQGNPVTTPGQRGEIVGTGFINTVMPFIRYRTGDFATYVSDHCEACGREHPIIRDIRGHRTQEMLVAGDGSEIPWVALNMHDDTFDHVRQFQFRQDEPGKAVLRVVPAGGFDDACRKRIQQNLGRKLDGRLDFTIDLVESIPLSVRGKAIYVDQRIPSSVGKGREGAPG